MKQLTKEGLKRAVLQYGGLIAGSAILSFGLYNVHSRSSITEGGVLGLQLLLQHWFRISPSITGPLMDAVCYLIGFRLLGGRFLKNAVIATISYSLFYSLHEHVGYLLPDMSGNPLLAAVLGGIFVGVGVGLVVRAGGASGGDDAVALIMSKLTKVRLERCYFITDFVIIMLSLSYIPIPKIACSLITVTLSSYIIGKIYGRKESDREAALAG